MKIRYLGTAAAEGVPAVFCKCANCENIRRLGYSEFRARTQVLLDGELCIDFPPEAYSNSLRFGVNLSDIRYLLVTHSHMDHFYAHDFILRGYKYAVTDGSALKIYGNQEVGKVFSECTAREMKDVVLKNISFTQISPFERFEVGGYTVTTIPANHSKTEDALLYHVEKGGKGYLHLYDTGRISDGAFEYLKECGCHADLVALDCTFGEHEGGEYSRHMGLPDDKITMQKLFEYGVADDKTKFIATHFSHNCNPVRERLEGICGELGVTPAYDGFEVEI